MARVTRKIVRPCGCPHQLPRIGCPAIASASDGTGPRPLSSTTPCFSMKAIAASGDDPSRSVMIYRLPASRIVFIASFLTSGGAWSRSWLRETDPGLPNWCVYHRLRVAGEPQNRIAKGEPHEEVAFPSPLRRSPGPIPRFWLRFEGIARKRPGLLDAAGPHRLSISAVGLLPMVRSQTWFIGLLGLRLRR